MTKLVPKVSEVDHDAHDLDPNFNFVLPKVSQVKKHKGKRVMQRIGQGIYRQYCIIIISA